MMLFSSGGKPLMVLNPLHGPACQRTGVVKHGQTADGKQRFLCENPAGTRQTFLREYVDKGLLPEVKKPIVDMAMNGSGIGDTARVRHISPTTVIETLKKRASHTSHESRGLVSGRAGDIEGSDPEG
jgi:transposase-like protein